MARHIFAATVSLLWCGFLCGFVYSQTATEEKLQEVVKQLTRQMVLQEFQAQERIRLEGDSGIVQVKNYETGDFNYQSFSHMADTVGSMHDHTQTNDSLGYGVLTAVLNGVQFTTRHNDPRLFMPSTTSTTWHKTEPIPFPDVPPSVLAQATIEDEIKEMQEYFRAFKNQDSTHRDYKTYFKPVLCYLEGAWLADTINLEEAFQSISWRYLRAYTSKDLQEQARLESYLGADISEKQRVANLPRTVFGFNESSGEPVFAQWHYRIMCQPLDTQNYLNTSFFKLRENFEFFQRHPDASFKSEKFYSRSSLFTLHEDGYQGFPEESLLDKLIRQVPGKDNIPGTLLEGKYIETQPLDISNINANVNGGFYNRVYQSKKNDYMRKKQHVRGHSDAHLYMALTSQEEVAPLPISFNFDKWKSVEYNDLRASWMIPLEIVYLTPLLKWNPHGFTYHTGDPQQDPAKSATNHAGTTTKPLEGISSFRYYQTPAAFYTDSARVEERVDADEYSTTVFVRDSMGVPQKVAPSGSYTVTPPIGNDVGYCRLRFPIFPVHFEGNGIWKEFNAFKAHVSERFHQLATMV